MELQRKTKNGVIPLTRKAPYKPDAGNLHVRFDERDVETEPRSNHYGTARRKGRKQICPTYRNRATSRLYRFRPWLQTLGDGRSTFDSSVTQLAAPAAIRPRGSRAALTVC